MTEVELHWFDYEYFPYEKRLAKREIEQLLPDVESMDFGEEKLSVTFNENGDIQKSLERLTYVHEVVGNGSSPVFTTQAKLESAEYNGAKPTEHDLSGNIRFKSPSRQRTRYSAHGIHEYKGKFNPQIVRAIGNILGLEKGDWLLDPFCGSGTTLLEAAHCGWNAVGIEVNPLAVAIAQTKADSIRISQDTLRTASDELLEDLEAKFSPFDCSRPFNKEQIKELVGSDWNYELDGYKYLSDWFTESVLVQLIAIRRRIRDIQDESVVSLFEVILSDILREVSQQDSGDLRMRRDDSAPENQAVFEEYQAKLRENVNKILRSRKFLPNTETSQVALNLDTRTFSNQVWEGMKRRNTTTPDGFDAAITSPPYATALPYVDTHRLSLLFFGYISPAEVRETDRQLIGTRNITKTTRSELQEDIQFNSDELPDYCISLCRDLQRAVNPDEDGFRRQNKPALVYRYLRDMKTAMAEVKSVLIESAPFALIVGHNQTTLGGQEFLIDNPKLLEEIGAQIGFKVVENTELDTHRRFNMHNTNHSIDTENLLVFRK